MIFYFLLIGIDAEKITKGTADAFAAFYEQYLPKVYKYVSYRITDKHLAEDLTSTVFEKALTKFKTYRADKASLATWVFRIARNTMIDYFRVRSKEQTVLLDEAYSGSSEIPSLEDEVIREEQRRTLQCYLAKLSPQEQEIISLKFGSGMANRQIAIVLGLTDSNVGVMLYRAVRKLRSEYLKVTDG